MTTPPTFAITTKRSASNNDREISPGKNSKHRSDEQQQPCSDDTRNTLPETLSDPLNRGLCQFCNEPLLHSKFNPGTILTLLHRTECGAIAMLLDSNSIFTGSDTQNSDVQVDSAGDDSYPDDANDDADGAIVYTTPGSDMRFHDDRCWILAQCCRFGMRYPAIAMLLQRFPHLHPTSMPDNLQHIFNTLYSRCEAIRASHRIPVVSTEDDLPTMYGTSSMPRDYDAVVSAAAASIAMPHDGAPISMGDDSSELWL